MVLLMVIICAVVFSISKRRHREKGFEIKTICIEGNEQLTDEEILALTEVAEGERLYESQKLAMRECLIENEWIEAVRIREGMGGVLIVAVKERVPIAVLKRSAPTLLCIDGAVIPFDAAFADLPAVYMHGKIDLSSVTARIRMLRDVLGVTEGLTIHFKRDESTFLELNGVKLRIGSNEPFPLEGAVKEAMSEMKERGYRICDMRFKDQIIFEKGGAL